MVDYSKLPPYPTHLLPQNATPLERAFTACVSARYDAVPIKIKEIKTPSKTPEDFVNFLAWEEGVDLWHEDWTDLKKRSVIAATIRTKEILGTQKGIATYLDIEDGALLDVVAPPQASFLNSALRDDQITEWLGRLPQLRIYWGDDLGTAQPGVTYVVEAGSVHNQYDAYVGHAFLMKDPARDLLGRRAFLYDPKTGSETRITLADLGVAVAPIAGISEQVKIPGSTNRYEAFTGRFIGDTFIIQPSDNPPMTVTYTLANDTTNQIDQGNIILSLGMSFDPVFTRYDHVPVFGHRTRDEAFIGVSFVGYDFVSLNSAHINFYDRLYIADPSVSAPATRGTTYIGHSRLGMDAYRAEMLVDAKEKTLPSIAYEGRYIGNCFAQIQDDEKRNRLLEAICMAQSGRDRIYVDFQVTEVITFGDGPTMDGSYELGQRIPRNRL